MHSLFFNRNEWMVFLLCEKKDFRDTSFDVMKSKRM